MNRYDLLLLPENVLWAWRKVKRCYRMTDALYDQAELAEFELCLESELAIIQGAFASGTYSLAPIRLVPQPKKPDKQNRPRLRQYFEISVRDQVAWAAVANVLGPDLDRRMPAWSYGNRLYRAAWYDEDEEGKHSKLNIGPYRHASGYLYRHFKHSWPLFRRHISLTARKMATGHIDPADLDQGEKLAHEQADGLRYLNNNYWPTPEGKSEKLYAASFDLKTFYPSIRTASIRAGFKSLTDDFEDSARFDVLLESMLRFPVDASGLSDEMQQLVDPKINGPSLPAVPTGLFVSGFLANVAMLPLDLEVNAILERHRNVAHFRFVDDHEILSYDFEALCNWVSQYCELLAKHDIGPEVEPDKYFPPDLKWILHSNLQEGRPPKTPEEIVEAVSREASVNGRKPTELMTRTLAQVSMLAATDFDLLTDTGRSQRLEQLEWLLLANIPEQEIRGDTRAAFAAGKISQLTPSLFKPSDKLLLAVRELRSLLSKKSLSPYEMDQIALLQVQIPSLKDDERKAWQAILRRHFGLLFEAFVAYPDKARLFIRLLDYCRTTGFDGLSRITHWMLEQKDSSTSLGLLKLFLGAMTLHTLARHILTAGASVNRKELLHREHEAAVSFLADVVTLNVDAYVPVAGVTKVIYPFQADALKAFAAALLLSAEDVAGYSEDLANKLRALAATLSLNGNAFTLDALPTTSGDPIGVWTHWQLSVTRQYTYEAPPYWARLSDLHDADDIRDWNSLRRYPKQLSNLAWTALSEDISLLMRSDAGWLFDASRSNPVAFEQLPADAPVVSDVRHAWSVPDGYVNLEDWIAHLSTIKQGDPRRSEWAALEIIRQVLEPLTAIDSTGADILDHLQPANILVPHSWIEIPEQFLIGGKLTWEGWRRVASGKRVTISASRLEDYRYSESTRNDDKSWSRRLRSIGQLLWGLLRQSFILPTAWNIRGQERGLMDLVSSDLEALPISSCTLAILRSCLLSRSRETSVIRLFPNLFGKVSSVPDDTKLDLPIPDPTQFEFLLRKAQDILADSQMTLLEHEPRQLIPVHLKQMSSIGDAEHADDGVGA